MDVPPAVDVLLPKLQTGSEPDHAATSSTEYFNSANVPPLMVIVKLLPSGVPFDWNIEISRRDE
jgi:hypothetical protein